MQNFSDKQLIYNYFKGDEKSLEFLIKRYLKPIYSFSYRNVGNIADAEDITQDVFIKVWKNLKRFDKDKNFKTWIFQIAKNTSIDFLRKRKTIPFSRFEDAKGRNIFSEKIISPVTPIGEVIDNKNAINFALGHLPPKYRTVFSSHYHDNLTFREIAESLGESVNTIKSRYRRALIIIRKFVY